MCGIFCVLNGTSFGIGKEKNDYVERAFKKGSPRGPEKSTLVTKDNIIFGFHRLAINGYGNATSDQPLMQNNCTLICNGEIYNWKELIAMCDLKCSTGSDCEVIIALYKKYGIEETLNLLDGVFAFVLVDHDAQLMFVARDSLGIRPLFMWRNTVYLDVVVFASELKMGSSLLRPRMEPKPFPPGHLMVLNYTQKGYLYKEPKPFFKIKSIPNNSIQTIAQTDRLIHDSLVAAVKKRVDNTDRPIACLLSGGLDSSLICSIVVRIFKEKYGEDGASRVTTWSIGMEGSEDLKYARKVADFLGTTHNEIKCTEEEFLDAIPEVIYAIESNDTTTVRASVGNYLICKYIRTNSPAKVIFNGDGSDELTGGYLYMHYAPDPIEFDIECRRLLRDIHLFDVLRSDRSISSNGLEARTPFLDRSFIQSYLSIPSSLRYHPSKKQPEKYLLRHAFSAGYYLPDEVLWRRKEAFSDGVSTQKKSWFEVIQERAQLICTRDYGMADMSGSEAEVTYYKRLFTDKFGSLAYNKDVMPYKWMPKFIDATDASARTLPIYKNK